MLGPAAYGKIGGQLYLTFVLLLPIVDLEHETSYPR